MMMYVFFATVVVVALIILLRPLLLVKKHILPILAAAVITTGTFGLYAFSGNPGSVAQLEAYHDQQAKLAGEIHDHLNKLKQNPEDAMLWARLGDSYGKRGEWDKASSALKKSVTLSEGNPAFIQSYAVSLYYEAGEKVTQESRDSFNMLMVLEPQNEVATYFIGLHEKQQGNLKRATEIWQELKSRLKPETPLYTQVSEQLKELGK